MRVNENRFNMYETGHLWTRIKLKWTFPSTIRISPNVIAEFRNWKNCTTENWNHSVFFRKEKISGKIQYGNNKNIYRKGKTGRHYFGAPASNTKYFGVPTDRDVRVAICVLDGLEIELIQPMDEKRIYAEHLRTHGEGYIHHLTITTDDNAGLRKIMKEEGIRSEWKGDVDPKLGMSFLKLVFEGDII